MNGKGDTYRPVDREKWSRNYDAIDWSKAGHRQQDKDGYARCRDCAALYSCTMCPDETSARCAGGAGICVRCDDDDWTEQE